MTTRWILQVALMAGVAVLSPRASVAEETKTEGAPALQAEQTITGLVTVTKDGDKVKQVTIGEGDAMVCVCTSTEPGKKVADFDGKTVQATGVLAEKAGKRVLTLSKLDEATQIIGVVTVTKDGDKVKQVTIGKGDAMVCVCTSTETGKKAADFAGKRVKATGVLTEKAGKRVLTVTQLEEAKKAPKAAK